VTSRGGNRPFGLIRVASLGLVTSVIVLVSLVTVGPATAGEVQPQQPIQESPNPPAWARSSSSCAVELTTAANPSGVVGYIGYNVSVLSIVSRHHVSCAVAKKLAREEWVDGPLTRPLRWRYVKAWRSTAGGSAYIGDFVGTHGTKRVEFHAVH
jgi:hypothetical protein